MAKYFSSKHCFKERTKMKKITIADVTLREGTKNPESSLNFREKLEISKLLDKLGVDVIEMNAVADEKTDTLVLRSISPLLKTSILSCPVGLSLPEIDRAYSAISGAAKPRLLVSLPVSAVQMEYHIHKKPAQMPDFIKELVSYAASLCNDVEFSAEDATRADKEFLANAINTAIAAGAKTVTVCDTAGTLLPTEFEELIEYLYAACPELKNVTLSVECNDEINTAVAAIFDSIAAGATQIKTCVNSATVPSLENVVKALTAKRTSAGIDFNVNSMILSNTIKQISRMSDIKNSPSPFDNYLGNSVEDSFLLDGSADITAVSQAVVRLGYDISDDDLAKVFEAFQGIADKKEIGSKELDTIVATVALQVPPTYKIKSFVINSGNIISSTANITLEKNGRILQAVCCGDGPIDASFLAIEQIIGHHYELDDFQIQSVTQGREAMGDTLVKLRSNGKLFSGRGISTDIIGASIKAYINALNKIVYEEN